MSYTIKSQILELQSLFRTTKIENESLVDELTTMQLLGVIEIIKNHKKDGDYYVDSIVSVKLINGKAYIIDTNE